MFLDGQLEGLGDVLEFGDRDETVLVLVDVRARVAHQ